MCARGLVCGAVWFCCVRSAFLLECPAFVRAGHVVLSVCFALDRAGHAFLSVCLAFDHACCLPHSAKQNGLRYVAFLFRRGSRSPIARSRIAGAVIRLGWFTLGLRVFCGDPDGSTRGRGGRRRRGVGALLRDHIGFAAFSAGSPLGRNVEAALRPRPQTCAKESSTLWTLFI